MGSPVGGLLADANAIVTATPGTAEQLSFLQEKLAKARAVAENSQSPSSLEHSAACLAEAAEAVRHLQAASAPSAPNAPAVPVSPLEDGQIGPSTVQYRAAAHPDMNGATPSTNGHVREEGHQQPAQGHSLASAFEDAMQDVLQVGAKQSVKRKKKKRKNAPAIEPMPTDQEAALMTGALICACTGAQLDDYYAQHRFHVPLSLARERRRIPAGLPVFLFNNDARLILGPFYAKDTAPGSAWVRVLTHSYGKLPALRQIAVLCQRFNMYLRTPARDRPFHYNTIVLPCDQQYWWRKDPLGNHLCAGEATQAAMHAGGGGGEGAATGDEGAGSAGGPARG